MLRPIVYPAARRAATTYVKHGVTVADPYHHFEDPDAEETKAFVSAQGKLFKDYLKAFPHRDALAELLTKKQNFPKFGAPSKRRIGYMYYYNPGLLNQSKLMVTKDLAEGAEATTFLDPNTLSADGTTSISQTAWSENEKYFAYATSEKGSDWNTIYIRDIEKNALLEEKIEWVKFSGISWLQDAGFFYTRFPTPTSSENTATLTDCAIYFHRIGTPQSEDVHIHARPDHNKWLLSLSVADDDKFAFVTVHDGCEPNNLIYYAPLPPNFATQPTALTFAPLFDTFEAKWDIIANNDDLVFFNTTLKAPNHRIVAVRLSNPSDIITVVPETTNTLESCDVARDTLFLCYIEDVKHTVYYRPLEGGSDVPLKPLLIPIGQVVGFGCRRKSDFVSVQVTSFTMPGRSFFFDVASPSELKRFRDNTVEGLNPDDFEVKQVFFDSEGARVPMYIVHAKGVVYDGTNPTQLYGYGGFNISVLPSFAVSRWIFMKHLRGVFVLANIRGGGEYGQAWHQGGSKLTKMNCYVDFCNAARELFKLGVTTPQKLSIMGGSNGGLLVAACANLHPELFAAVVCQVGVLDMYKFHQFTIGHAWTSDFGDPENEEDFKYLTKYSPLHNIRDDVAYPSVLVVTADHDDRVVPMHSLKYLAELQHRNPCKDTDRPFLGRIEENAGHGAGKPLSKAIEESADIYSYLALALGATWTPE